MFASWIQQVGSRVLRMRLIDFLHHEHLVVFHIDFYFCWVIIFVGRVKGLQTWQGRQILDLADLLVQVTQEKLILFIPLKLFQNVAFVSLLLVSRYMTH